ncbi:MAG: hypothetical protein DWQ34_25705 [Planctomycetota bacterium]|nr:MAG: hypothetical protein DWQ34_25705 [Planctomycetota bacterium]REJ90412.1 MAG: hypothetical protein DWQ29_06735 [Planctomycetota bacterium]REK24973.1 MAG: hypothetical protein DWQ41_13020 [Planctomycetota bacterium]REK36090.1 MAG: hypothetical protein DWQ45_10430 [Planctomycetota bacterium]
MESRTLLVEGPDDQHVMWAIFHHHNVPEMFDVEATNGIDKLLETVPVRLRVASGLERLAVVIDADEAMEHRWSQLRDSLANAGVAQLPSTPDQNGTTVELDDGRRFGAWLMPNNRLPGMLESFLAFLIPGSDELLPHVDALLEGLPAPRRFSDVKESKARIHSWLALQEDPGKPMGQAITARYLDADAGEVRSFLNWIDAALIQ